MLRRSVHYAALAFATIGTLTLAACSNDRSSAPTVEEHSTASAERSGGLMVVERSGGLCASGNTCSSTLTVNRDGAWTIEPDGKAGKLPKPLITHLVNIVDTGGGSLDRLPRKNPVSCPSSADGQDVTFTFQTSSGSVAVSNCTHIFNDSNPVIREAHRVMDTVG